MIFSLVSFVGQVQDPGNTQAGILGLASTDNGLKILIASSKRRPPSTMIFWICWKTCSLNHQAELSVGLSNDLIVRFKKLCANITVTRGV